MESNVPELKEKPQDPVKKLTREQIRYKERIEADARMQLSTFVSRFYEFFMDNDPAGGEIILKRKELSAKWKMYCHQKNLSKSALVLFDDNAQRILDEYKENLKDEPTLADKMLDVVRPESHPTPEKVLGSAKEDPLI